MDKILSEASSVVGDLPASLLHATDEDGWTLLHYAAFEGDLESTKDLIAKGSDVNSRNATLETPLHIACQELHTTLIQPLLEQGADVNAADNDGCTAVMRVCRACDASIDGAETDSALPILQQLAAAGADLNARSQDRFTAMHLASRGGQLQILHFLKNSGADFLVKDRIGRSVLHYAGTPETVELLCDALGDHFAAMVDSADDSGRTPLRTACEREDVGGPALVKALLNAGALVPFAPSVPTAGHDAEPSPQLSLDAAVCNSLFLWLKELVAKDGPIDPTDRRALQWAVRSPAAAAVFKSELAKLMPWVREVVGVSSRAYTYAGSRTSLKQSTSTRDSSSGSSAPSTDAIAPVASEVPTLAALPAPAAPSPKRLFVMRGGREATPEAIDALRTQRLAPLMDDAWHRRRHVVACYVITRRDRKAAAATSSK